MADEQQQQHQGLLGGGLQQGPMFVLEELDMDMDAAGDEAAGSKAMPSPEEQAAAIEQLEDKQIQAGEQMYIVSKSWWNEWCAYTRYKQQPADSSSVSDMDANARSPPLEIDNSSIVDNNSGDLARNLEENCQFVIVTAESWELLHSWYGGGPVVSRPAVLEGLAPNTKRARVMLYPIKLDVIWSGKPTEIKTMEAEMKETVQSLKLRACAEFGVEPASIEIWDFFHHSKHANLESHLDKTLNEARILDEQPILLDEKDNPLECESKSSSSPIITSSRGIFGRSNSYVQEDSTVQRSDGRPGLVGLQNLGNTCFMNSSLQCLMHTVPIMSVFLSGTYEGDLNTANPLGMKGQLATAFGSLISNVWRPEVGTVVPRGFKAKIAQFAPQFSGYAQHDSQEFLAFLLDGLHEDINRIQQKPYIEENDSEGVPDAELAKRAWDNYRLRNDSHIVDHFQGLYKSTLVCPQCSYSSVKFDPFMYLSLPLPESKVRQLTVILLHADGAAPPREYGLEVPQTGSVKDLYLALARVANLPLLAPEQQMVAARLCQRFNYGLTVFDDPKARISELMGRDANDGALLVYYYRQPELGPAGEGNQKVVVYHRKAGIRRSYGSDDKFSAPLLMWVPLDQTYDPELHVVPSNAAKQQAAGTSSSKFADVGSPTNSSSKDVEYVVTEDAPIWLHIRRMLRPFLAVPALRQQPPTLDEAAAAAGDEAAADAPQAMQQDDEQQQQEQQAGSGSAVADVSMAAASGLPGSPVASPSPEPCCTSRAADAADAAAPGGDAAGASAAAAAVGVKAGSEAGEGNSTWGSQGSDSPRSDVDMTGLDEAAAAVAAGIADDEAAAAAGATALVDSPPPPSQQQQQLEGEEDTSAAAAALAMQQLGAAAGGSSGGEAAAAAAAAAGSGLLGQGGVPVQPLDIWSAQPQATTTSPVDTPPGSTTGAAAAGGSSSSSTWPHYQLKLARDSHDYATVVSPWFTAHFHPNAHHTTMVLDWHLSSSYTVPYQEYAVAAATAAALETAETVFGQQQQQQDTQQQNSQQQQDARLQQHAGSTESSSNDVSFWVPDLSGVSADGQPLGEQPLVEEVEICGAYCMQPLLQPEYDGSTAAIKAARADPRGKAVSLDACVEAFLQPEQLSEADEWYCPKCKEHVQADKKLDLWSLPEVLVVHLKRFSYTRWNRDKLDTQVLFPLAELDLSRYVLHTQEQPPMYDCFAVSNHYGGMGGGHYTAFAHMPNDRKWFCFDDSRVEEMSAEGVQSRAAYVLFYRRRQQVQSDAPSLVDDLLQQRQQHLEQKRLQQQQQREQDDAAAAATAAVGELQSAVAPPQSPVAADVAAMEMDAPAMIGSAAAAAAPEAGAAVPLSTSPAEGEAGGGRVDNSTAAAAAAAAQPAVRIGLPSADSSSTSSKGLAGAADDGDSSDGSSSRPRRRAGDNTLQQATSSQQQQQGGGRGLDDEGVLQDLVPQAAALRRPSDQDADADMVDMTDRDV